MKNKKYIYAHINPNNNKVFYIGLNFYDKNRGFSIENRNKEWREEVSKIGGFENVIVRIEKILPNNISYSKARSIEYKIAQKYYNIGENYCSRENKLDGENNPNYNNKWTKEQKEHMSQKMKGRYAGKNNPNYNNKWSKEQKEKLSKKLTGTRVGKNNSNSKKCILYFPDGSKKTFDTKSDMQNWGRKHLNHTLRTLKPNKKHYFQRNDLKKYNGLFYTQE